jgi:putative two-component system response regulator
LNVVLIDDSRSVLLALRVELEKLENVAIETYENPEVAIKACAEKQFDLVLVDYNMPKMTGIDVVVALKGMPSYDLVPIVMITSETEALLKVNAIEAGVTEFLQKPVDLVELKARVKNLLNLRRAHVELSRRADGLVAVVHAKSNELAASEEEIIWRLARAIEYRDGATGDHVSRVAQISLLIAQDLKLDADLCRRIYLAAPLHDIGKIGISDEILCKPGRLTPAERDTMRQHVDIGVQILGNATSDLLLVAERIAGGHHEKWDGSGYPKGLAGEQIPLEARIVALADVFDALCSARPYKPAWSLQDALAFVFRESGRHFDPACVDAFNRQWSGIVSIMETSRQEASRQETSSGPLLDPKPLDYPKPRSQLVGRRSR